MKLKITAKVIDDQNADVEHNIHNMILINLAKELEKGKKVITNELFECPKISQQLTSFILSDMDISSLNYVVNTIKNSTPLNEIIEKYSKGATDLQIQQLITDPKTTLSLYIEQYISQPTQRLPPIEYKEEIILTPRLT
ncbi:MAG: hypothetical protein QM504_06690 [Pseudomonadota bacterium]